MKIVVVSGPWYLDTLVPLVNELATSHEIVLFLVDEKLPPPVAGPGSLPRSGMYEFLGNLDTRVKIHLDAMSSLRSKNVTSWRTAVSILSRVQSERPDICHMQVMLTQFLPLGAVQRKRLVVDVHDPILRHGESPSWSVGPRHWMFLRLSRMVLLHNDAQRVQFQASYRLDSRRITVIPLGALSFTRGGQLAQVAPEKATVLFFGRIAQYKGLEYLAESWKSVRENVVDARLIVAGAGDMGMATRRLLDDTTVEVYNRSLSLSEAGGLFARASIVVLPYVEATQSGVLMMAYGSGKPVVVTDAGGLAELVEDGRTGCVVPPRNPARLADAIVSLLNDRQKREAMAGRIREKCQHELSWSMISEQTVDVYRRIMKG